MGVIPAYYDYINARSAKESPSTVHCKNTALVQFFTKYLLQKVISVYDFTLPDDWAKNYFTYVLFCRGYIGVLNTDKFGIICQQCGLEGYDVYYQPKRITVSNPLLRGILNPVIGKQCTVIKLQPDYSGAMDIIAYYADMLALTSESIGINLLNSHLSYAFAAGSKNAAESFKKIYDQVASGEPAVFFDKSLLTEDGRKTYDYFVQDLKSNYLASAMLADLQTIEDQFYTEIGIKNANTQKRERLITSEVQANNQATQSLSDVWLDNLQKGIDDTNKMFGTDIKVVKRYITTGGGSNGDNDIDGTL